MINAKFDKIELTKHPMKVIGSMHLKNNLAYWGRVFLEIDKVTNHLFGEYKSLSSLFQIPYHHGNLKTHVTKIQILTSTLHLYATILKHPLKTHYKHQKATEIDY